MSQLTSIAPGAWDELLERLGCADAYLRADYLAASLLLDEGEPVFLHLSDTGGDVVFAGIARPVPGSSLRDVTTPYGYGGPVAVGTDPPAGRFYDLYGSWCAENGVVSTFIRFHPLFANHVYAASTVHVSPLGPTVGWRLNEGDLFAQMHRSHRNKCRKAGRAGVRIEATPAPDDLADFVRLYEGTMRRQQADDFYFFPRTYWDNLATLGDRLVRFDALLEDGDLVASALCLATRPWLHYHLSATLDVARELGASNLLLYEAALWAREAGFGAFHLGGGVGGREDSLFTFKRCFSPDDLVECQIGKSVHDVEAYRRLTGRREIDLDDYFPAYRLTARVSNQAVSPSPIAKSDAEQTCQLSEANGSS